MHKFKVGKSYLVESMVLMPVQTAEDIAMLIDIRTGNRYVDLTFPISRTTQLDPGFIYTSLFNPNILLGEKISNSEKNEYIEMVWQHRQQKTEELKPKPDVVEFFRYIRPYDHVAQSPIGNMGATLKFTLDYKNRIITLVAAVCKNETFSKAVGKQMCEKLADRQWSFIMPHTGIPETGVCEFVVRQLIQLSQLGNAYKEVHGILREVIKMSQGEYDKF